MIGGRGAGYVLLGLAGLLLVLAVTSSWSGAQRIRTRGGGAVEAAAAAFVTAYGTFDHRDQGAYATRLIPLTAGPMRQALAEAEIVSDAARLQRMIATHIESVSVTALSKAEATALVTAVQERRWVDPVLATAHQEDVRQRVICRLAEEGGRWLVIELRLHAEEPVRP